MAHQTTSKRGALAVVIGALVLLSLLPARWGQWVGGIGGMAQLVILPVAGPIYQTIRWLEPRSSSGGPESVLLQQEAARWKTMFLQERAKLEEYERKHELLKQGAIYLEAPVRQLLRPVIEATSLNGQRITVRGGSRDGVEMNTVAVTAAFQLVGRVSDVRPRTSHVRLITDRTSGRMWGVVMVADDVKGPKSLLSPVEGGKLQGRVENSDVRPQVGQLVRLDDDGWPRSARMLVIGRIEAVQPDPVGWPIITVKPTVELLRLSEVELRIIPLDEDAGGKP